MLSPHAKKPAQLFLIPSRLDIKVWGSQFMIVVINRPQRTFSVLVAEPSDYYQLTVDKLVSVEGVSTVRYPLYSMKAIIERLKPPFTLGQALHKRLITSYYPPSTLPQT